MENRMEMENLMEMGILTGVENPMATESLTATVLLFLFHDSLHLDGMMASLRLAKIIYSKSISYKYYSKTLLLPKHTATHNTSGIKLKWK